MGFIPMRSTFWYLYDISQKYNLHPIKSSILLSTGQTLIDFPVDILKTRQIISQTVKPNLFKMFGFHYMRNLSFSYTLLNCHYYNKQFNYPLHPVYSTFLGCSIGSIISQPFDVWKMKTFQSLPIGRPAFTGIIPRLLITSTGITIGSIVHAIISNY